MSEDGMTRREFIERASLAAAAAGTLPAPGISGEESPAKLPQRALGRTGFRTSILAFGCGSRWLMYKDEDEALRVVGHAIDSGINYVDTAWAYGNGLSETRLGKLMKARRKDVWLATKIRQTLRKRDEVLREFEAALKRLQTDHVDLLHLHSLGGDDDLAKIEAPDGAIKALYELRDQKTARFIGMTSHTDGAVMARAIEHNDLDCVQMAMNPARANRFEELALPAARKKNLGIILMKVTAQDKLLGAGSRTAPVDALLRYALTLPVSTCVIGMPKPEHLEKNLAIARAFKAMDPSEMDALRNQLAGAQVELERFFAHHHDAAWA